MGVLDSALILGRETTYGTAVTLTDGIEAQTDGWVLQKQKIESVGMRAGMQARRADRVKYVDMGGAFSFEFDVLNKGFGFIMPQLLGSIAGPTQVGATTAYLTTAATTAAGPDDSLTAQMIKSDADGTLVAYTHTGAVITDWSLEHPMDGNLKFACNGVSSTVATDVATGTPTYPTNADTFDWGMAGYTINGGAFRCTDSFSLSTSLGYKTNRKCQRQNTALKQPYRSQLPQFTGELNIEYIGQDIYDLYVADTPFEIVATWTGAEIETGQNYELTITMPNCQISDDATPIVELGGDVPMQRVAFEVYEGSSDAMTMTYKSTDTTL